MYGGVGVVFDSIRCTLDSIRCEVYSGFGVVFDGVGQYKVVFDSIVSSDGVCW